jgi:hypothetical protein
VCSSDLDPPSFEEDQLFVEALAYYRAGNFIEAKNIFFQLTISYPWKIYAMYYARCEKLETVPLPDTWKGIWDHT